VSGFLEMDRRPSFQAYLINLPRRKNRLCRMIDIRPACLEYIRVETLGKKFDAQAFTIEDLAAYGYFPWKIDPQFLYNRLVYANWDRPLKLGEIGCAIAHHLCWSDSRQRDLNYTIILEDDVVFAQDFCGKLQAGLKLLDRDFPDWDLIYLGRLPAEPDRQRLQGFVVPGFSYFTHGYVLSRRGVSKILGTDYLSSIIPVDELLPALYLDHPRADVRARYPKILHAFAFEPQIAGQLPKDETNSDTEASGFLEMPGGE
jgi:glycosyl transferase, family 25